jgi:hypothetical protein
MGGGTSALGRRAAVDHGHGRRFAGRVAVAARGDDAHPLAAPPGGVNPAGIGLAGRPFSVTPPVMCAPARRLLSASTSGSRLVRRDGGVAAASVAWDPPVVCRLDLPVTTDRSVRRTSDQPSPAE